MPDPNQIAPYVLIPQRLCIDLRDSPVAIGVYAFIARLFLITHAAVPLSAGDIERFDRQTSYGQARRALERLCSNNWLIVTTLGRKNAYLPTWGMIGESVRPWDRSIAKFGRPAHVRTYRIGAEQFDQIAYLTPHTHLTAVIRHGAVTHTLSAIGRELLEASGLRVADDRDSAQPEPFFGPFKLPDQPIPQLIGQASSADTSCAALECPTLPSIGPDLRMPWESWAMNQQINQQATMQIEQEHGSAEALEYTANILNQGHTQQLQPTSWCGLDETVAAGHLTLNQDRTVPPGEWLELATLQRLHGIEQLLIWQARAQRRHDPIERITPLYYRTCAANQALAALSSESGSIASVQSNPAQDGETDGAEATGRARGSDRNCVGQRQPRRSARNVPTGQVAEQLRSLGIQALAGLGQCDPELVGLWVEASTHPDWTCIWNDPGAAARALLLRGELPPDHTTITRRAAARRQSAPADWAELAGASGGCARLGDDLAGLDAAPPVCGPDDALAACDLDNQIASAVVLASADDEPAERLRMALRLYTPTRAAFQAVERINVRLTADQLLVTPGRSEDIPILRPLLPMMTRAAEGRQVVLLIQQI